MRIGEGCDGQEGGLRRALDVVVGVRDLMPNSTG